MSSYLKQTKKMNIFQRCKIPSHYLEVKVNETENNKESSSEDKSTPVQFTKPLVTTGQLINNSSSPAYTQADSAHKIFSFHCSGVSCLDSLGVSCFCFHLESKKRGKKMFSIKKSANPNKSNCLPEDSNEALSRVTRLGNNGGA